MHAECPAHPSHCVSRGAFSYVSAHPLHENEFSPGPEKLGKVHRSQMSGDQEIDQEIQQQDDHERDEINDHCNMNIHDHDGTCQLEDTGKTPVREW